MMGVHARVSPAQAARLEQIEELLGEGAVRIDDLAVRLSVSEMTIRRDLDELDALGVARRVRGGAVPLGPESFDERHRHNAKAKAKIAEKLRSQVPTTGTIAFDASSTVHRVASQLDGARDLMLVTNGVDTFNVLREQAGVRPLLTGGSLEPRTGSLVGPLASRSAADFLFDVFICSAAAIAPEWGASEVSLAESEVKLALARHSDRVVVAVDGSKLGERARARVFDLSDIDLLVTDLDPDDDRLGPYRGLVDII